jgi:CheY-like chemotaxis protein
MKTILFIDATRGGVSIPERILRRAGYLVHAVRDGRSGLSLAAPRPPDLIFVGSPAGALRGPALYRAFKDHPACRWTPILAAVPAGEDPRPEDSPEDPGAVGADETIHLPINPFELLAKARFLTATRDGARHPGSRCGETPCSRLGRCRPRAIS